MNIVTNTILAVGFTLSLIVTSAHSDPNEDYSRVVEGDSYNFVSEYVRELAAVERIRANAEQESREKNSNPSADCIRNSTRFQLELGSDVKILRRMKLEAPVNNLIPQIMLYEQKISLWQQFGDGCAQFIAGPKPNVDYGQIAAEFPKINAKLEYVDQTLFSATPLVFAALIDQRPDSENHLSHLLITKVQRDTLVGQLTLAFGQKLDQRNQNYTVSAASVLKGYLTKDYKCSDEP